MGDELFRNGIPTRLSGEYGIRGRIKFSGSGIRISSTASRLMTRIISDLSSQVSGDEFSKILDEVLKEAISSSIWRTRNGVNDIVSSGDLRDSSKITNTGNNLRISYDVPYANLIHYGGYIVPYGNTNAGRIYIPPRPWVATVLGGRFNGFDPEDVYLQIISRLLSV